MSKTTLRIYDTFIKYNTLFKIVLWPLATNQCQIDFVKFLMSVSWYSRWVRGKIMQCFTKKKGKDYGKAEKMNTNSLLNIVIFLHSSPINPVVTATGGLTPWLGNTGIKYLKYIGNKVKTSSPSTIYYSKMLLIHCIIILVHQYNIY